jgi:hypothetical protein
MKNKNIVHAKEAAKMYSHAYKPSTNLWRFMKSIVGAWFYGSSTPHDYPPHRRWSK